jgi:hypothetical protein
MRPVRAKRSGHRAIRYKSVQAQIQHTSGFPLLSLAEGVLLNSFAGQKSFCFFLKIETNTFAFPYNT